MTTSLSSLSLFFFLKPISFFLLFLCFHHVNSQLYQREHSVLLRINRFWKNQAPITHWLSSNVSHCSWPEVQCTNNSVTALFFSFYNLNGTIPSFICDLKNLTHLDFQLNFFTGGFPTALYSCSNLNYLDLSQNLLTGPIPDDVDRLSRLQFLSLGGNSFSGEIPVSISRLSELRFLHLYVNQFNGTYPSEIGNLLNLEELLMAYNLQLEPAELPSTFAQLSKLTYLWMAKSNVIGEIPEWIGNLTALVKLDLSRNNLIGKIPNSLFTLKNLSIVYLFKNNLSGEIPQRIDSKGIIEYDLSENNLTGRIPAAIGDLQNLTALLLFTNHLYGEIPESIGRLPLLTDVRLFDNNLNGTLPPDFGRNLILEGFQVNSNKLTGSLPEHLCSGGKLKGLIAYENNLSGELPKSLGNCDSLIIVDVHENNISGEIPAGLWTALNLTYAVMNNNSFTGDFPLTVSKNLARFQISNNKISGEIPSELSSFWNLTEFEASNNLLTGNIPEELTALSKLYKLSLDGNQLNGELPKKIFSWKSLQRLKLNGNRLSGEIPDKLGYLPNLNDLDLSENQLSGSIPISLGKLALNFLNLSSNFLSGVIPSALENAIFARSFLNNPSLCSNNAVLNLDGCSLRTQNSRKISSQHLALIVSLGVIVVILFAVSALFIIKIYRRNGYRADVEWKLTSFQRLNFSEANLLSGLSENNVIGSGGSGKVYRIPVNSLGETVAVKKIWNNRKSDHKLEKQFMAEVKILSSIRHNNIIKLLCCVSCETSKLLVYEYMEKQSLDKWLHKNSPPRITGSEPISGVALDWPTRFQIAVGAAQGLCYMHHECSPPVIHRDLKSSNILLDSDFNAKIADFGLAKLLIKQGEPASVSAVAGSFGYIAPEYAQTPRINEKIDVFSFGVILLELATGKEALNGDADSSLAEWAWDYIQKGKPIADALDEDVKEPQYLDEMCSVFKLGLICTSGLPTNRPNMNQALQILIRSRTSAPQNHGDKKQDQ
ncbi:hypothetical protein IC582_003012 [Cucumis melo]|uniref:Receptor-like protein kinase 5 n=2 Tax=Cucumis melo TaxID=3656 RepID=A0A5D3CIA2_CUCMM|nr:receptor-like protein kinase 5 [Cucumis melo]TYK10146.1 receptor-like protein kinase 5 [Cucumis melo var. makuwa]